MRGYSKGLAGVAAVAVAAAAVVAFLPSGQGGPSGQGRPSSQSGTGKSGPPVGLGRVRRSDDPFRIAKGYVRTRRGRVTAAAEDLRTGRIWTLGDGTPQPEASVVKLDILQTLLARRPGGLPPAQRALAREMITVSDNDAATALWNAAGGAAGIGAYNTTAGLARTRLSSCVSCPGFGWPGWGLSTTTPADQIALLRQVAGPGTLLSPTARRYALSLLENVTPSQRWGVSGGVPAGVSVALKNGWLPLRGDADWQVNSAGWVSGEGRDYLLVILSTGSPSQRYGMATVSRLGALAWSALG